MKKFNAIHILEEEQERKDLMSRNLGKENYIKQQTRFMKKYIYPILIKLNNEGKIVYNLNTDDEEILYKSKCLEFDIFNIVNSFILENTLKNNIDILTTDDKNLINAFLQDLKEFVEDNYSILNDD